MHTEATKALHGSLSDSEGSSEIDMDTGGETKTMPAFTDMVNYIQTKVCEKTCRLSHRWPEIFFVLASIVTNRARLALFVL